jgi:hypothetical protein
MANNFLNEYIKKIIDLRYPHLPQAERQLKLQNQFKLIINNIRAITQTREIDPYNSPMGFLFQHIKPDIMTIIANCSSTNDKLYLERHLTANFDWNIRLFNTLKTLNAKDLMIWLFLHVPYYNHNPIQNHNIHQYRLLYESLIDHFIKTDIWEPEFYPTEKEFLFISNETCMPYALSYHNMNNATILSKYCQLIRKICPWVNYYSGRLANRLFTNTHHPDTLKRDTLKPDTLKQKPDRKIRICFVSDSFQTDSSVLRDRVSIIGKLDKTRFEVYFGSFYPFEAIRGVISKIFFQTIYSQSRYIYLLKDYTGDSPLDNARITLEKLDLDYIVYPDLGMKILPTLLAYSRIAKTQITTWGHSETSGIDTIDYFISSEWFETIPTAQEHYTEKLILFKSLGTYYISPDKLFIKSISGNPSISRVFKTRKECGFPDSANIYCCLQTFYKITPEFENVLGRILELDPNGYILLSNSFPYCQSHLARIRNTLGDNKLARVKWYPSLDKFDFLNLVAIADVVLDPFPFGGCNTSFDAFDYNIPVITMSGQYLHGRFTIGLYRRMGMEDCECITTNPEQYAQIASQIALNPKLRHKINRNIEMNKKYIFQEDASIIEWNEFFSDKII